MATEFLQKRGLNFRKFILSGDKIIVETKTYRKNDKFEVRLDKLGFQIHYQSENTIAKKIMLGICLTSSLVSILGYAFLSTPKDVFMYIFNAVIWAVIACFAYFHKPQDDLFLIGGEKNLVFYRNVPNEKLVLEFIEMLKDKIKANLKEKYAFFDNSTYEEEFIFRLNWLLEKEAITKDEFLEYKTQFEIQKLF